MSMFFMTLPVLLCLCFVPLACCCFPCFVRFLLAMRVNDNAMVGATQSDLDTLPSKAFDPLTFQVSSDDDKAPQCTICLSTYVSARKDFEANLDPDVAVQAHSVFRG